jgi:hypothetical protein
MLSGNDHRRHRVTDRVAPCHRDLTLRIRVLYHPHNADCSVNRYSVGNTRMRYGGAVGVTLTRGSAVGRERFLEYLLSVTHEQVSAHDDASSEYSPR